MKYGSGKINIILECISNIALLISYIFFIIQAIINIYFIHNKSKKIITERLLYEHFSEEIYSNIKSYPFSNIIPMEIKDIFNNYLNLEVKLDTYFDCQGIKSNFLNEKVCQDKIIHNFTCCKSECCTRINSGEEFTCTNYSFNLKNINYDNRILNYNDEEMFDDPRRRYCKYFNKYIGNTSKISDYYLKIEKFRYNYEELLLEQKDNSIFIGNETPSSDYEDCGELDTYKNHLYLKNINCPINFITIEENELNFDSISANSNSLSIIIRNILSEIPPSVHEWKNEYIDKNEEEDNKNKSITIKDINKLIKEKEDYYTRQEAFLFINNISEYNDSYKEKINNNQKIYWYTLNYIGFENSEELNKFKKIFNENDPTDNPLFKIRNKLFPSIASLIIGIILIILSLIYIIYFLIMIKKKYRYKKIDKILLIIKDIIILLTFLVGTIIYIILTYSKFKSINIKLDDNYKEILKLYNKRRFQMFFLLSIIIMGLITGFEFYFLFFANKDREDENILSQNEDIKSEKTDKTELKNKEVKIRDGAYTERPLKKSTNVIQFEQNNQITNE